MYSNIGRKIKVMAQTLCWAGILCSLLLAIIQWVSSSTYHDNTASGFVVLIAGSLLSWVGSFALYGFGELIEHVKNIDNALNGTESKSKIDTLKELRDRGLITDNEYAEKTNS